MARPRIYASAKEKQRAYRARLAASAGHRLDAPTPPVVAVVDHADPVSVLADWSRKTLLSGKPMTLPDFALDWLRATCRDKQRAYRARLAAGAQFPEISGCYDSSFVTNTHAPRRPTPSRKEIAQSLSLPQPINRRVSRALHRRRRCT